MKILCTHPGSSVSTHDVFMGLIEGLNSLDQQVSVFPLDRCITASQQYLKILRDHERNDLKMDLPEEIPQAQVICQASEGLLVRCLTTKPDWVVIVSGMYLPLATVQLLKMIGQKVCLILTESPYDEAQEAKWASVADVTFSNERVTARKIGAHYLPHAWRHGVHDAPQKPATSHDVLFVGTGFAERTAWLERYTSAGGPLTLYGSWLEDSMRPFRADPGKEQNYLVNEEATELYASAKVGLNLYRTSVGDSGFSDEPQHIEEASAESMNPRAYELAAVGCPYVSTPRAEISEIFGELVPQAQSPEEAADHVKRFLALSEGDRSALRLSLQRAMNGHSWRDRTESVLHALA